MRALVGDYWGFNQHLAMKNIAVFKVSSEVIKFLIIGAASFGQNPRCPIGGCWGVLQIRLFKGWSSEGWVGSMLNLRPL